MRITAFLILLLALAATACQTTYDPELERELRYMNSIGP